MEPEQSELHEVEDDRAWNIGKCQKCQFFDIDREIEPATDETIAPCLHPDMEEFELVVSGDSGCNLFEICEELEGLEDDIEDQPEE